MMSFMPPGFPPPCGESDAWQRASIQGARLEYHIEGDGDVVALIHGGLIAGGLDPLANALRVEGRHRTLTWNRVGYAGSGPVKGHAAISAQAGQLAGLLHHLEIQRTHVVGHSSGGLIALQLALDHPGVARSLVLLEAALPLPGASNPRIGRALQIYGTGDRSGAIDAFMSAVAGADWRRNVEHALPRFMDQASADAGSFFEHELPAVRGWHFDNVDAARIRVPVLAVLGGASEEVSPVWKYRHEYLLAHLPEVEPYVLPGARHWMALEDPRALAHRLRQFFAPRPRPR